MGLIDASNEPLLVYVSTNEVRILKNIGKLQLVDNKLYIYTSTEIFIGSVDLSLSGSKQFLQDINNYIDNFLKLEYDAKKLILGKYALVKEKNE